MKLLLNVNKDRLNEKDMTIDERLLIIEGGADLGSLRDLLAWFVTDEEGNYLPEAAAKKVVGKVKKSEQTEVWNQFTTALVKELLPNASTSSSSGPSDTTGEDQTG